MVTKYDKYTRFHFQKKAYGLVSSHPQTHAEIDIYGACIYEQKQWKVSL